MSSCYNFMLLILWHKMRRIIQDFPSSLYFLTTQTRGTDGNEWKIRKFFIINLRMGRSINILHPTTKSFRFSSEHCLHEWLPRNWDIHHNIPSPSTPVSERMRNEFPYFHLKGKWTQTMKWNRKISNDRNEEGKSIYWINIV